MNIVQSFQRVFCDKHVRANAMQLSIIIRNGSVRVGFQASPYLLDDASWYRYRDTSSMSNMRIVVSKLKF